MRLKLILPYRTILDKKVEKITAPGSNGTFQILPKHIDGTWTLESGILVISLENSKELYYAINQGVAVKEAGTVYISTFRAIAGESLEELSETVRKSLDELSSREKKAREVLIKLETDTIKKFMEIDL